LTLSDRNISGKEIEEIAHISKLRVLSFVRCSFPSNDFNNVFKLSELSSLLVNDCRIDDSDTIDLLRCQKLRQIVFQRTEIGDATLAQLCQLHTLEYLDLSYSKKIAKGVASLSLLPALKSLNLDGTSVDDSVLEPLLKSKNLESLTVDDSKVSALSASAALSAFVPYRTGVRQQVFEVIVRQAMAGAPWQDICRGPLEVNEISEEEILVELERRKSSA